MPDEDSEDDRIRSVALQNATGIHAARRRAEERLLRANDALEEKARALARSLSLLRVTLESTTEGIVVVDGERNVVTFNEQFVQLWGLDRAVVEGASHPALLREVSRRFVDPEAFEARIREIYASAEAESYDLLEPKDGRAIERFSRRLVGDEPVGRVWSFRDITDRRRAEEARFRLAALVESSDDAIISKDLNGVIASWNHAAERIFGYTSEEAVGRPITMIIPREHVADEAMILARLRAGERIDHFETVRVRKDGSLIDVSLTVSPIRDASGRIIGASKIARDISGRKLAAKEREQLLEAERAARGEAERVSLLKDEFLANISHELRTPLNAILGWSQMLALRAARDPELRQGLETISRNAQLQAQLIEDLLDMNRIISGKVRLDVQRIDLARVVEQAVATVRPSAEAKGIALRQHLQPGLDAVAADPSRLQQVVWNLLANAVKFTPKGGWIEVRLQRVDAHLEIVVSDSGIGIRPEFLPHVFERFRQGDASTTRVYGGLGLGLSIVKQLVELHGGTVHATSAGQGQGATFAVRLPLAPPRADAERERPAMWPILAGDELLVGVKVLVVEDEADARELIRRVLVHCKADVCLAASAREGLELIASYRPDLLISDIGMPEMDGYEFIRQVRRRAHGEGGSVPAIALTAFARSEDRANALLAGYQIHLSKPIEPQELIATVVSLRRRPAREA